MQDIGIALLIIAALELLSGIYIFVTRVKGHIVYAHSIIVLGVVLWVAGNGMFALNTLVDALYFWTRFIYIGAVILTIGFVYFSYAFPYFDVPLHRGTVLLLAGSFLYFTWVMGFTNKLLAGVQGQTQFGIHPVLFGDLYHLFIVWFLALFVWAFVNLLRKLKKAQGVHRWQIKSVFLGVLLSFLVGATFNVFLPLLGGPQWFFVGAGSSIFWLAFTSYIVFNKKAR